MRKIIILLAALLVIGLMPASLAEFGLVATTTTQAACATDTLLYIVQVTNTGGLADSYTVSLSGNAAEWAIAAPAGFNLEPGEIENVYVYVTPASGALVGNYGLDVIINGQHSGKQTAELEIGVANCHSVVLQAASTTQEACVCTMATYPMTITNTGKYAENFELKLSGNAEKWATLSDTLVRLDSGESKEIFAYITPACDSAGEFELSVSAKSQNSNALATQNVDIISQPCYDFDISPEKNYISFCENTEVKMPIVIKNEGTADNTYTFTVEGPRWATMENEEITVPAGTEAVAKLVLFPEYRVAGDFTVKVTAVGELGEVAAEKELTANILTCHATDIKVSAEKDVVCPYTSKVYKISLANTGDYTEHYAVSVSGAEWASVDEAFVELAPESSYSLNLEIDPKDVPAGDYVLKVTAESQDSCKTTDVADVIITIAPTDKCFGVQASSAFASVDVAYGEGALVPIVIENKGTEKSSYYLDVSGTGASYAQLNPAVVELEGREAETVYMYVAVPEATPQTRYAVTVSARLEDGTTSSSTTVDVIVVPSEEGATAPQLPELKLPDLGIDREEIKSNVGEKISGLTGGVSEEMGEGAGKVSEQLSAFKDKAKEFLFTKTYWFSNWLWILIIVIIFVIVGAALRVLPDEEENGNKKKKNDNGKKKGKEGGFWKKIEDFLEEGDEEEE